MELLPEIKKRKSIIVFQDKEIHKHKLDLLIEAARWAPSCFNKQPWNYIFVDKKHKTRKDFSKALSLGNGWAKEAPYLVAVTADSDKACDNNGLPYYMYDCGLSVMNFVIQGEHLGIRSHQMSGWDEKKVKKALNVPKNHRVVVVLAIGYEKDPEKISDKIMDTFKQKITRARTRKEKKENFFFGKFK